MFFYLHFPSGWGLGGKNESRSFVLEDEKDHLPCMWLLPKFSPEIKANNLKWKIEDMNSYH